LPRALPATKLDHINQHASRPDLDTFLPIRRRLAADRDWRVGREA